MAGIRDWLKVRRERHELEAVYDKANVEAAELDVACQKLQLQILERELCRSAYHQELQNQIRERGNPKDYTS